MSVQSAHNSTASNVGSLAATFGSPVSNNALVRGFVLWSASDLTYLTAVQDDKGNSYAIVDKVVNTAQGISAASFYKEGINNGPTVITATLDAGNFKTAPMTLCIAEESGIATATAIDGHAAQAQDNPGLGTDVITSGNLTTAQNGDLVCSGVINSPAANEVAGTGYAARESDTSNFQMKCEDIIQVSSGAIAGTWTDAVSGDSRGYVTSAMGFKAAGGISSSNMTHSAGRFIGWTI